MPTHMYLHTCTYQAAEVFAACCALGAAIEAAGTLSSDDVASALRNLSLQEFFGDKALAFNANGQATVGMLVVQRLPVQLPSRVQQGGSSLWPCARA